MEEEFEVKVVWQGVGGPTALLAWLDESGRKSSWVADRLGVDASLISHWLGARRVPSAEQAAALEALSSGLVRASSW